MRLKFLNSWFWQLDHDAFKCITANYSLCHQSRIQKHSKSLEDYDIFMGGQHFITDLRTWGKEQEKLPKLLRNISEVTLENNCP